MAPSTAALLKRWYDFMVAHDELLFPPEITDVTDAFAGTYNMDLDVDFGDIAISERAEPGKIWRRITQVGHRIVIHLINLAGQTDALWDAPRRPISQVGNGRLTLDRLAAVAKRVQVASPDDQGVLVEVMPTDGSPSYPLPGLMTWQMIVVELHPA
jgi:dextranase